MQPLHVVLAGTAVMAVGAQGCGAELWNKDCVDGGSACKQPLHVVLAGTAVMSVGEEGCGQRCEQCV